MSEPINHPGWDFASIRRQIQERNMARSRAILAEVALGLGVKLSDESLTRLVKTQGRLLDELRFAVLREAQRTSVPTPEELAAQGAVLRRYRKVLRARHRAELAAWAEALDALALGGSADEASAPEDGDE